MKRKSFVTLAAVLLYIVLGASFGHGGSYYVNSSIGDNNNTGKLPTSPWESITHAVTEAHTGTAGNPVIIYVAPGNYVSANEAFPIVLDKHVHLIGTGNIATDTFIEPGTYNETLTGDISPYSALSIKGDGVIDLSG